MLLNRGWLPEGRIRAATATGWAVVGLALTGQAVAAAAAAGWPAASSSSAAAAAAGSMEVGWLQGKG